MEIISQLEAKVILKLFWLLLIVCLISHNNFALGDGDVIGADVVQPHPDYDPHWCHKHRSFCDNKIYRKIMQHVCQTTCGKDSCQDKREDLCMWWATNGFCESKTFSVDVKVEWCQRTCAGRIPEDKNPHCSPQRPPPPATPSEPAPAQPEAQGTAPANP